MLLRRVTRARFDLFTFGFRKCISTQVRHKSYVQGQSHEAEPKTREYFYYIDHQGYVWQYQVNTSKSTLFFIPFHCLQLFLDDAKIKNFTSCFKDKAFLRFFFSRLKFNMTANYNNEFPYLSPCGVERNYVRCNDLPIVFTNIIEEGDEYFLYYAHAGDKLKVPFEPEKLYMCPKSGRLYHPSFPKLGNVGLVKSSLAIDLSENFNFSKSDNQLNASGFTWNDIKYSLTQEISDNVKKYSRVICKKNGVA